MRVVLFTIGKFTVYGYGLMYAIAIIVSVSVAMLRAKRYGENADTLFNAALIGIIGGLIGSKVLYWIVTIKDIIANPRLLLDLGSGFVVYGGLIFGLLCPVIYLKFIKKETPLRYLDLAVASIILGQAIGRIGCLLAGCCYGMELSSHAWYALVFPEHCNAPAGLPLFPSQIVSSIGDLLIFIVLVILSNKEKFAGEIIAAYAVLYSLGRFVIEFFRGDVERGQVGALSTSQFIAIFVFVAGILLFFWFKKLNVEPLKVGKKKKEKEA